MSEPAVSENPPARPGNSKFAILATNVTVLLILIVTFELGMQGLRNFRVKRHADDIAQDRFRSIPADAYPDRSWLLQHFREYNPEVNWGTYETFRAKPSSGATVNVEASGLRKTWNPGGVRDPVKVFVFGGSTAWGMGSRDEFTIPSYISKELNRMLPNQVVVTNYGQHGYNSTQVLLSLSQEITAGRLPDVAVFYGGFNDVSATLQQGAPGRELNEGNRIYEFNLMTRPGGLMQSLFRLSGTYWFLSRLAEKMGRPVPARYAGAPRTDADRERLIGPMLRRYEINTVAGDALGAKYSFSTWNYWQPTVFFKNPRTPFEEQIKREDPLLESFFAVQDTELQRSSLLRSSNFRDLTRVYDGIPETLFLDWAHATERANEIIAKRIVTDIAPAVQAAARNRHSAQ